MGRLEKLHDLFGGSHRALYIARFFGPSLNSRATSTNARKAGDLGPTRKVQEQPRHNRRLASRGAKVHEVDVIVLNGEVHDSKLWTGRTSDTRT